MFICLSLFDELVNDISVNVHERDCVVYVAFPKRGFVSSIFEDLRFEFSRVDISKNYCLFDDHGGHPCGTLQVILFVELEWVPFSCKGFEMKKGGGGGGGGGFLCKISRTLCILCTAYEKYYYALSLWYICVKARNMHWNEYQLNEYQALFFFFCKLHEVCCIVEIWLVLLCDRLKLIALLSL